LELSQYSQLVFLLGLGAPALAAATAFVFDIQKKTVELYLVILSLFVLFLGYQVVQIPDLSSLVIGFSVLGVGLGYALVKWEAKVRSAQKFSTHRSRYIYVLIAGVEEVFYRGLLLGLALSLPGWPAQSFAIAALIFWFAAIHVETSFIWKLPLSLALTAIAIASGSVFPAIAAHVTYNLLVVRNDY